MLRITLVASMIFFSIIHFLKVKSIYLMALTTAVKMVANSIGSLLS